MTDLAAGLAMVAAVVLAHRVFLEIPNRHALGWRDARIAFSSVGLEVDGFAPLKLAGAWQLSSDDPRFGGISALAIDRGRMLALTDSGVLVRFSAPGQPPGPAWIGELPDGPGSSNFKHNHDSEALLRDPHDRGWWVAFENRDESWLYDQDLGRGLERIHLGDRGWGTNRGVEGMAADGDALLLLPEGGQPAAGHRTAGAVDGYRQRPRTYLRCCDRRLWPIPRD
ncbi:MAG: esterase-like activity of phytase family protein [Sphingomicrobium sp.]